MVEKLYTKQAGMEPLPGYRLLEPLGSGGYGEVWKCEVTGGINKAIKFVRGNLNSLDPEKTAQQELEAFERIKAIRHPFLLSLERVEIVDGELIIAMELADENLEDQLNQYQKQGLVGIPRKILLHFLSDAAEALDLLRFDYDLQHLDVKPSNLFVVRNHVKVADFGLVRSLIETGGTPGSSLAGGITPHYSCPELIQGNISPYSDQYSLAIVYQELLTGTMPFSGQSARQLMLKHIMDYPELGPLPESDREIVAKALAKNPNERFSSCQEFVKALTFAERNDSKTPITFVRIIDNLEKPSQKNPSMPAETLSVVGSTETEPKKLFDGNLFEEHQQEPEKSSTGPNTDSIPGFKVLETLNSCFPSKLLKVRSQDDYFFLGLWLEDSQGHPLNVEHFKTKISQIRHDALPRQDIAQIQGRSLLLSEYNHPTLLEMAQVEVERGGIGIRAEDLIKKIAAAASALDSLYDQYQVPHLCLNPNSILGEGEQVWFIDFGVIPFVWWPTFRSFKGLNLRYSAPEVSVNRFFKTTDQYSLALVYTELLTGILPRSKGSRRKLDLTFLPSSDHKVLTKALDPQHEKRFPTCSAFVEALKEGRNLGRGSSSRSIDHAAPMVRVTNLTANEIFTATTRKEAIETWERLVSEICEVREFVKAKNCQYVAKQDSSLYSEMPLDLPDGFLKTKLNAFAEESRGTICEAEGKTIVVKWPIKRTFWNRLGKGETGVEVRIQLKSAKSAVTHHAGAQIFVQFFGNGDANAAEFLQSMGPKLLESLSKHLHFAPEKRRCLRLPSDKPVLTVPILPDLKVAPPISATIVDVSLRGARIHFLEKRTFKHFYLAFDPTLDQLGQAFFAKIKWTEPIEKGIIAGVSLF